MSRIRDLMRDIGDDAPSPPHDLAERALAKTGGTRSGRRWASVPTMAAAAASVAAVVVGASLAVPSVMSERNSATSSATGNPVETGVVRSPEQAETLPAEGVDSVVVTYQQPCGDEAGCEPWRVVTVNGKHYELPAPEDGGPAVRTEVTVSPSGDRIAYQRANGHVVLRGLDSGKVTKLFDRDADAATLSPGDVSGTYAWSADGRWLLAVPRIDCNPDESECHAMDPKRGDHSWLVDTKSGDINDLGRAGSSIEPTNGTGPILFDGWVADPTKGNQLAWMDRKSSDVEKVFRGDAANTFYGGDGSSISVAPDGSTIVWMTRTLPGREGRVKVDGPERDLAWQVSVYDGESFERRKNHLVDEDWTKVRFLGWQDNNHVLVGGRTGNSSESDRATRSVEILDVRDGSTQLVLKLPDGPAHFRIASGLF